MSKMKKGTLDEERRSGLDSMKHIGRAPLDIEHHDSIEKKLEVDEEPVVSSKK